MKQKHDFEHTVFKCLVLLKNQSDANQAKQICIDNDLPIWDRRDAFDINNSNNINEDNYLFFCSDDYFYVDVEDPDNFEHSQIISLTEFETLSKDYNSNLYKSINDILFEIKELNKILNNK